LSLSVDGVDSQGGSQSSCPLPPGIDNAPGQGHDGNLLVIEMCDALELEMHLALLRSLSDQTHQPRSEMADEQKYFEARSRA
jgi:hypothetical protein